MLILIEGYSEPLHRKQTLKQQQQQISRYSSAELGIIFSHETANISSKNVSLKALTKNLAKAFDKSSIW